MAAPPPTIVLYSKADCQPCFETHELLSALLAERRRDDEPAPTVLVCDVADDPAWASRYGAEVPVVEIGDRRLPLATSALRLRHFLDEALEPVPAR
jgi:Glutaredoxin-like domain (DUF836)